MAHFSYTQLGLTGARIAAGDLVLCEILDLRLCHVRFAANGAILIGGDVGIPLYWMQYANHQHPDRNAAAHGKVKMVQSEGDRLQVRATGFNLAGEIESTVLLTLEFDPATKTYTYRFDAALKILPGKAWLVTPNPDHGEVEFLNLYPLDAFTGDTGRGKRYQACYVRNGEVVTRIPHHHLETPDKHSIRMLEGDDFFWLLEKENPAVKILSEAPVSAGLCAYMWDAHFGYRVCQGGEPVLLQGPREFRASWLLYGLRNVEGERLHRLAKESTPADLTLMPIYVEGVNRFSPLSEEAIQTRHDLWPWSSHKDDSNVILFVDHNEGYDDRSSLSIASGGEGAGQWIATTLGPAFGGKEFHANKRHRLRAYVRTADLRGISRLAIRLHRKGSPDLFDVSMYERYDSAPSLKGTNAWTELEVLTPTISPAPDRLHLVLEQHGAGRSWFDNVSYEELP